MGPSSIPAVTDLRSPLHASHERLGARFTDFGGWEMPLQYVGTLAEHNAVRTGCGVFDVSHLGRFELAGTGADELISRLLCNDPARIEPGRLQLADRARDVIRISEIMNDVEIGQVGASDHPGTRPLAPVPRQITVEHIPPLEDVDQNSHPFLGAELPLTDMIHMEQ